MDVHNLELTDAPRESLEVARSDSVALMDLDVASQHGAGVVLDSSVHVYLGSSTVATAGDALLVQASAGGKAGLPVSLNPCAACGLCSRNTWRPSLLGPGAALRLALAVWRAAKKPSSFLYIDSMRLRSRGAALAVGGVMHADITSVMIQNVVIQPSRRHAPFYCSGTRVPQTLNASVHACCCTSTTDV